jgi:hypothetical protein
MLDAGDPPHEAADAVEALAGAFRTRDAAEVREWVARARSATRTATAQDGSLGMGVVGHAVSSIADDLEGSAHARDAVQLAVSATRAQRFPFRHRADAKQRRP